MLLRAVLLLRTVLRYRSGATERMGDHRVSRLGQADVVVGVGRVLRDLLMYHMGLLDLLMVKLLLRLLLLLLLEVWVLDGVHRDRGGTGRLRGDFPHWNSVGGKRKREERERNKNVNLGSGNNNTTHGSETLKKKRTRDSFIFRRKSPHVDLAGRNKQSRKNERAHEFGTHRSRWPP